MSKCISVCIDFVNTLLKSLDIALMFLYYILSLGKYFCFILCVIGVFFCYVVSSTESDALETSHTICLFEHLYLDNIRFF